MQIISILFVFAIIKVLQYFFSINLAGLFDTKWGMLLAIGMALTALFLFIMTEMKARSERLEKLSVDLFYGLIITIFIVSFIFPALFASFMAGMFLFGYLGQEAEFQKKLLKHNPNFRYYYAALSFLPIGIFSTHPQNKNTALIIYLLCLIFSFVVSHSLSHVDKETTKDENKSQITNLTSEPQDYTYLIVGTFFLTASVASNYMFRFVEFERSDELSELITRSFANGLSICFYLLGSIMLFSTISEILVRFATKEPNNNEAEKQSNINQTPDAAEG